MASTKVIPIISLAEPQGTTLSAAAAAAAILGANVTEAALASDAADIGHLILPKDGKAILVLDITAKGTAGVCTISAGDGARHGIGALAIDLDTATNGDVIAVPIESARFKILSNADALTAGQIVVTLSGTTVTANAVCVLLPS